MRNRSGKAVGADQNQTALDIIEQDASQGDAAVSPIKNKAAVALGRKGGRKGGRVRADRMTAEERRASAQKAATMRWAKTPTELAEPEAVEPEPLNGEVMPPS